MRDLALYAHILLGLAVIVLSVWILFELNKKSSKMVRPLAAVTALASWLLLIPAGYFYILFYPATKTLIKAGAWPWAHAIFMETKEHWGIFLPVIVTVAAWLVYTNRAEASRKWWKLAIIVAILIAVMGRIVVMGATA